MTNELLIAIISAVIGGVVTLLTTLVIERQRERREDRLESKKLQREVFQNRPEMQVVDYKDYIARTGYGIKMKCDIEIFVAHIDNVTIEGKKKYAIVNAHYKDEQLNPDEWCCVIYTLKNAGNTAISSMDILWHYQQSSCIFPADEAHQWADGNLLNYSYCFDKKIRVGETIVLKICYHKDAIIPGMFSATISIGMIDDNGRYWTQPLFAPQNKMYDSRPISPKEYIDQTRNDIAEECFKKPWLW